MVFDLLFCIFLTMSRDRATDAQLRRAAGSHSLPNLIEAIETGWTVDDINRMSSEGKGKGALHMAAWQGSLDNVKYLLDIGCEIDAISTAEFSYGKTPIFFALTRSRHEVVDYLLDRGAWVKIVNNKGQSVLSIAASHLSEELVCKIQAKELLQVGPFWNFRATHSDGFEYGDLDPRFLGENRPVRPNDIVTELVINPTTKESRKGGFQRRNPEVVAGETSCTKPKQQKPRIKKAVTSFLSNEESAELQVAWRKLLNGFGQEQELSCCPDLLTIVRCGDKQRRAWIPEAYDKLANFDSTRVYDLIEKTAGFASLREASLLAKLRQRVVNGPRADENQSPRSNRTERQDSSLRAKVMLDSEPWPEACELVSGLSISALELKNFPILSLPEPPVWIGTTDQLRRLLESVQDCRLVSIDTEWYDDTDRESSAAATLQIAYLESSRPKTFVIDLLSIEPDYLQLAQELVRIIFESDIMVLGFAFGHDVQKLEEFVERKLPTDGVLDLQLIMTQTASSVPGLKACAARFSKVPLSKEEQCSNWSRRPLSQSQINYAALDAVVLLYILAEQYQQEENGSGEDGTV